MLEPEPVQVIPLSFDKSGRLIRAQFEVQLRSRPPNEGQRGIRLFGCCEGRMMMMMMTNNVLNYL